jgi:hypothetical protein
VVAKTLPSQPLSEGGAGGVSAPATAVIIWFSGLFSLARVLTNRSTAPNPPPKRGEDPGHRTEMNALAWQDQRSTTPGQPPERPGPIFSL